MKTLNVQRRLLNVTVDVFYNISMEDWESLALLTSECHNMIKKDVEDHKRKIQLCKILKKNSCKRKF